MSGAFNGKIVMAVTGGDFYSLARTSDGGLYSWGDNTDGQLGTGNNTASNVPVAVTGLGGKLVAARTRASSMRWHSPRWGRCMPLVED